MYLRYKSFEMFIEREKLPFRFEFVIHPLEDGFLVLFGGKWRLTLSKN